jgi:DNA-nicking Smr family endonuclease
MTTLDLHGRKHEDVQILLDNFIYNHMKKKTSRIYVITGNSDEMKKIVSKISSEHGLTAVENMFHSAEIIIDL